MRKYLITCSLLLLACTGLYAQKTEDFAIPSAAVKVKNSLYNKFTCIDSRPDTSEMGIVQLGAFNRKAKVVPKIALATQLNKLFTELADETAGKSELLLQIRQFSFAEVTGTFSEKGYCFMRAGIYAKTDNQYRQLGIIDTVICLKSSVDVTGLIKEAAAKVISSFIADNLSREAKGPAYAYDNILHIDNYEKRSVTLYNTAAYVDGLYLNYQSFSKQVPDKQVYVDDEDNVNKGDVKTPDSTGVLGKVKLTNVYAIVVKGKPYVVNRNEFVPIKKKDNDLVFVAKGKGTANTTDVIMASMFFGVAGSLLVTNQEALYQMKIDHINGGFIRMYEIPKNAQKLEQ